VQRLSTLKNEEYPEIGLTLLDKGFYTEVNVSNIRRLPAELNQAPRTILRCTLSDVYPLSLETSGVIKSLDILYNRLIYFTFL